MTRVNVTDASYITSEAFDAVVHVKFQQNTDDETVRSQAIKFLDLLRASRFRQQVIADILQATNISGREIPERIAEVGFLMGLQFGFELAASYPPSRSGANVPRS